MPTDNAATLHGYLRLAVAVLAQAAADAATGDQAAHDFLLSPQVELMLGRLGLPVEYCRRLLDMPARPNTGAEGEWLTVAQAAARCGCHPEAIRKRIRAGRLQARGGGRGREWKVLAEGLEDTNRPGTHTPTPQRLKSNAHHV